MDRGTIQLESVNKTGRWAHGFCGCFDNMGICLIVYCVPCVTFGQTSEALGKGCVAYGCFFNIPFLNCVLLTQQRSELRRLRDIEGNGFSDCCLTAWCTLCTLSQEAQEVEEIKREQNIGNTVIVIQQGIPPQPQQMYPEYREYPPQQAGNPPQQPGYGAPPGYPSQEGYNNPGAYPPSNAPPDYNGLPPKGDEMDRK